MHAEPRRRLAVRIRMPPAIARGDVAALCRAVESAVLSSQATLVVCDMERVDTPSLAAADALARIQLTTRRLGCQLRLRRDDDRLWALLRLTGLDQTLPGPAPPKEDVKPAARPPPR